MLAHVAILFLACLFFWTAGLAFWHGGRGLLDRVSGDTATVCMPIPTPFVFRCQEELHGKHYPAPLQFVPLTIAWGLFTTLIGCIWSNAAIRPS
jgi:hypothetical protein